MAKRSSGNGGFFKPTGDPVEDIIGAGANIIVNYGLQRLSVEAAKLFGINQSSIKNQIELKRSQLQVEKVKLEIERTQLLGERQVRILDIRIHEKEIELEERRKKIETAQGEKAQLSLPQTTEVVTGALEITATHEGLISPEQSEGYYAWLETFPSGKVILILGRRGSGKTALAAKIAEYMLVTHRMPIYWIGLPRPARGLLPHWVNMADSIEQVPPGCLIIVDEAGLHYLSLAFGTEENVLLRKLLMICRHRNCSLVFAVQSSRDLENSVVRQADSIIFKEPGLNQPDSERPDLRKRARRAALAFKELDKEERCQTAFVFDDSFEGLIKSSLPSFWSEDLSHVYAHFDLASMQQQVVKSQQLHKVVVQETKLLDVASLDKQILELRRRGNSIEKIARDLGCTVWRVRKCLEGLRDSSL